ncbi:putative ABC transporter ATP-binding protein [Oscillibacter valericigenes Sjm18-20]|nr:putative ABC transporter ATP-binding protein [Oscillibacter valericigenes Sjm18-20]
MSIELKNVTKRFGQVEALKDVSVTFAGGKMCGLLGNNGAGKSTLMSLVAGRIYPTAGEILIDGEPADSNRAQGKLFLMSEGNLFPEDMKVKTAMNLAGGFYPGYDKAEAEALTERFELNAKSKINKLSTGYGSIFKLVLALACNAPYLLLDEPVLGLDAQHREMFYKLLLEKYAANRCAVIFSTHLIYEAANLVEHAVVIRKGRILKDAPVEELTAGAYTVSGPAAAMDEYLLGRTVLSESGIGGLKTAAVEGEPGQVPTGLEITGLNLQDYFIALMEKEDRT